MLKPTLLVGYCAGTENARVENLAPNRLAKHRPRCGVSLQATFLSIQTFHIHVFYLFKSV